MDNIYADHTTGPPQNLASHMYYQNVTDGYYGLTPTLVQQEQYMPQDVSSFESMFLVDPSMPDRRPMKRAFSSSSESVPRLPLDSKKQRIALVSMDSDRSMASSQAGFSTATSNHDSADSNCPSPPSDAYSNKNSPAPELILERVAMARSLSGLNASALPKTSTGQTPSVLLQANTDYSQLYHYQQQAPDGQHSVSPKHSPTLAERLRANPPPSPVKLTQSGRRSKAAAMQHLEELEDDEHGEEDDDASMSKGKGGKRQGRRKSIAKGVLLTREEEEDKSLDGEEDKRAQFLERNRLAACKSRQKKKEWIKSLEVQSEELTRHNGDLQVLVTALREEITSLRSAFAAHSQCSCRVSSSTCASDNHTAESTLPQTADAALYAAAPWAGMALSQQKMAHEMSTQSALPNNATTIQFNDPASGMTPLFGNGASDNDYFNQTFAASQRPVLDTPELARSLGYAQ